MSKAFFTFTACRNIIREASLCETETGGILVGLPNPLIIVGAGSPGRNALKHETKFTSDPSEDRRFLADVRNMYCDAIIPLGYWHKHPPRFDKPSSGDCHQASQLMKKYNDGQPVLMGIVNHIPRSGRCKTTLQVYSLNSEGHLVRHPWALISGQSSEFQKAVAAAVSAPKTRDSDYWHDSDFQFYLNPIGRKRIKMELESLRSAGWEVVSGRDLTNGNLVLDMHKDLRLRMVLPPEYPMNPPQVFENGSRLLILRTLSQWNSLSLLLDVASEFVSLKRQLE